MKLILGFPIFPYFSFLTFNFRFVNIYTILEWKISSYNPIPFSRLLATQRQIEMTIPLDSESTWTSISTSKVTQLEAMSQIIFWKNRGLSTSNEENETFTVFIRCVEKTVLTYLGWPIKGEINENLYLNMGKKNSKIFKVPKFQILN